MVDELLGKREVSVRELHRTVAPPEHSGRLAVIDEIVWHLLGTYDGEGVRRWFKRPRSQLEGKCPVDALGTDWTPDSDGTRQVLSLARELSGATRFLHPHPLAVKNPDHLDYELAVLRAAALLTGNLRDAATWYFTDRIGVLDGLTGEELVLQGRASDVLRYIETLEAGFAG
jgi:hypothetical protein